VPTNLQAPQQQLSNPNLKPEEADTTTAGLVYKPNWFPRFSLAIDGYRITIAGYINSINGGNQVIQQICIASGGTSPFCALTPRPFPISNTTSANLLTATVQQPQNIASLDTYGADFEANYVTSVFGRNLSLRGLASYQPHILLNQGPSGYVDNGGTNPNPNWKLNIQARYAVTDNLNITIQEKWRNSLRWTGVVNTPANGPIPAIVAPVYSTPPIPSISFVNLNVAYTIKRDYGNTELYLNISNLFNQPPGTAGNGGSVPGLFGGFVAGDDTVGRYFMIGLRFRH
jgi:outer membrane receptor protein involved in Fe transport